MASGRVIGGGRSRGRLGGVPFALAGVAALLALPAQAVVVVIPTAAAFTAATTVPGLDLFSDLVDGTTYGTSLARTAGAYSYTAATTGFLFGVAPGSNLALSTNDPNVSITLSGFSSTVRALSGEFFVTNLLGSFLTGGITVTVSDVGGGSNSVTLNPSAVGTGSFAGFLSDVALSSVTISAVISGTDRWATLDSLTLAQASAVPEPATWALGLAGALALGLRQRRRAGAAAR